MPGRDAGSMTDPGGAGCRPACARPVADRHAPAVMKAGAKRRRGCVLARAWFSPSGRSVVPSSRGGRDGGPRERPLRGRGIRLRPARAPSGQQQPPDPCRKRPVSGIPVAWTARSRRPRCPTATTRVRAPVSVRAGRSGCQAVGSRRSPRRAPVRRAVTGHFK